MTHAGRCMCGAVTFDTNGEPSRVLHCHCESCRRHGGAAMATLVVFHPDQVTFGGTERRLFNSRPQVNRAFCGDCGSSLTWETTLGREPICAIHLSAFDNPDSLPAEGVSFYTEKISWFDSHDTLPRFEGFVVGRDPVRYGPA